MRPGSWSSVKSDLVVGQALECDLVVGQAHAILVTVKQCPSIRSIPVVAQRMWRVCSCCSADGIEDLLV